MSGLFITLILWLAGSIVLLWQTSIVVLRRGIMPEFLPFFVAVMVMDATTAFIYYGEWVADIWFVFRLLWLASFMLFFTIWIRIIIKFAKK